MKKAILLTAAILLVLLFSLPNNAIAHPGNTASDGCHYCRTNCSSWGVAWDERHCHGGSRATPPSFLILPPPPPPRLFLPPPPAPKPPPPPPVSQPPPPMIERPIQQDVLGVSVTQDDNNFDGDSVGFGAAAAVVIISAGTIIYRKLIRKIK